MIINERMYGPVIPKIVDLLTVIHYEESYIKERSHHVGRDLVVCVRQETAREKVYLESK